MESSPDVRFSDEFPDLPANAPPGHPHIIHHRDFRNKFGALSLVDVVVTILYNYSKDALEAFLDSSRREYVFWNGSLSYHVLPFFITRNGKTLLVSFIFSAPS